MQLNLDVKEEKRTDPGNYFWKATILDKTVEKLFADVQIPPL